MLQIPDVTDIIECVQFRIIKWSTNMYIIRQVVVVEEHCHQIQQIML